MRAYLSPLAAKGIIGLGNKTIGLGSKTIGLGSKTIGLTGMTWNAGLLLGRNGCSVLQWVGVSAKAILYSVYCILLQCTHMYCISVLHQCIASV